MKKILFFLLPVLCCFLGCKLVYEHTLLREAQELRRAFLEDYNDRLIMRWLDNIRSEQRGSVQGHQIPADDDMPFLNTGYSLQIDCCHEGKTYTRSYIVSLLPDEAELILKQRDMLPVYYRNSMLNGVNVTRGMTLCVDTCESFAELSTVTDKDGKVHPATCVRFHIEDTAAGSASPSPKRSSALYIANQGSDAVPEGH